MMLREVYSHLGTVRHRTEVVEYRVEQHAAALADRLSSLEGSRKAPVNSSTLG